MEQDIIYTVRTGDTLSAIAKWYNTTVEQLQAWNGISDPNVIRIGQRLIVGKQASHFPDQDGSGQGQFEPFPGKEWFAGLPDSPIIVSMGIRLVHEGCSRYPYPGDESCVSSRWDEYHRQSYAEWQRRLGYSGPDADGVPGRRSWDLLRVPRVSELAD